VQKGQNKSVVCADFGTVWIGAHGEAHGGLRCIVLAQLELNVRKVVPRFGNIRVSLARSFVGTPGGFSVRLDVLMIETVCESRAWMVCVKRQCARNRVTHRLSFIAKKM
jgi:hypothetical protein